MLFVKITPEMETRKEKYRKYREEIVHMAERISGKDGSEAAVKGNASQKLQRFIALNHLAKES